LDIRDGGVPRVYQNNYELWINLNEEWGEKQKSREVAESYVYYELNE